MAKSGMFNLSEADMSNMVKYPNKKAIEFGSREPYYSKYIREQKEKEKAKENEKKN